MSDETAVGKIAEEVFGPDKSKRDPGTGSGFLFARFPVWAVDSGLIAVMKPTECKVYLVLLRRADFTTRNGRIGNKTIARETGVNWKTVSAIMGALEQYGLIKTWRRGRARHYHVREAPPVDIKNLVKFFCRDKCPRNMDIYQRGAGGKFEKREQRP